MNCCGSGMADDSLGVLWFDDFEPIEARYFRCSTFPKEIMSKSSAMFFCSKIGTACYLL